MRISDWSSDVCSSDLLPPRKTPHIHVRRPCGVLSAASAATEGTRSSRSRQQQQQNNVNSAVGRGYSPDLLLDPIPTLLSLGLVADERLLGIKVVRQGMLRGTGYL